MFTFLQGGVNVQANIVQMMEFLKSQIDLDKVNNTSDLEKPLSIDMVNALKLKMDKIDYQSVYTDIGTIPSLSIIDNLKLAGIYYGSGTVGVTLNGENFIYILMLSPAIQIQFSDKGI